MVPCFELIIFSTSTLHIFKLIFLKHFSKQYQQLLIKINKLPINVFQLIYLADDDDVAE